MPFVHQTRDTFVPRLSRGQSNLNCAQHLQRCKRHQLGRTCRLHPVANMASKKQDAAKRSGVKPDEQEGINNWVCVSDEQYEIFLKKLAACSKPKQFKTVIAASKVSEHWSCTILTKRSFLKSVLAERFSASSFPQAAKSLTCLK